MNSPSIRNTNNHRAQSGFTFVEVMVGIAIVSIASLAVYYMFVYGNELMEEQYHRKMAMEKAVSRIEEIAFLTKKEMSVPQHLVGEFDEILFEAGSGEMDDIVARVNVTVTESDVRNPYPNPSNPNFLAPAYFEVSVTYNWEEQSGRDYDVQIKTRVL